MAVALLGVLHLELHLIAPGFTGNDVGPTVCLNVIREGKYDQDLSTPCNIAINHPASDNAASVECTLVELTSEASVPRGAMQRIDAERYHHTS